MAEPEPINEDHPPDPARFDVVVYRRKDRKIMEIAGQSLPRWDGRGPVEHTAERVKALTEDRTNSMHSVAIIPTGSHRKGWELAGSEPTKPRYL